MLRRTTLLAIPTYNFGHPALSKEFAAHPKAATPKKPATGSSTTTATATTATPAATTTTESKPKVTTCPNGARIITHNLGGAHVSIGAYIEAGAKYDPVTAPGLNYVFRWALTTSNMDNSLFQIDRTIRSVGAAMDHLEAYKKHVGLRIDARADMWQSPVENLFTCVSAPRFHEADIERFRDTMDNLLEEQRWQNPREYSVDRLESLAFYKEPLGSPRHVRAEANDVCKPAKLLEFWAKHCIPSRVVIAGVNVDHQALVAAYENAPFPHSAEAPHHARSEKVTLDQKNEAATYSGGIELHEQENRAKEISTSPEMAPETIAAVGYKAFGRECGLQDYAACLVAQQAMNIIIKDAIRYERDDTHHGVRSFYRPYSSAGLMGFTVRADPGTINKAIVDGLTIVKGLDQAKLEAAKTMASVSFYNNYLETHRDYCDFLGTSFTDGEKRIDEAEVLAAIKGVTADGIKRVQKSMTEAKPVLYVMGETFTVPSLRQLGF